MASRSVSSKDVALLHPQTCVHECQNDSSKSSDDDGDDDGDDDDDDDDGSVMTSYLPVGYRADRENPYKRKSKGASKKQVSSWYQPFDLVE